MGSQVGMEEALFIPLDEYPTFNLENAVCNHGFFMMAPNNWDPSAKCLKRPLRLSDSTTSVNVTISQPSHQHHLLIKLDDGPQIISSNSDKEVILAQVRRMLRLSSKDEEDVQAFHGVHPEAKHKGFGRIFRSPSFFEDSVKCILLCFCNIQKSLEMARLLCEVQSRLSANRTTKRENSASVESKGLKRKRVAFAPAKSTHPYGNFPTAKEVASLDVHILKQQCKLGLRAHHVFEFAKSVDSGKIKISKFEECQSFKELSQSLRKIKGFGTYASANALMCLGFYQSVPVDSETKRHLKEIHGKEVSRRKNIQAIIKDTYEKFAPFQCLAFWFELSEYYEARFGKLSDLPTSMYGGVSGSLKNRYS